MALYKLEDKYDKPSQLRHCKMCSHSRVCVKTGMVWLERYTAPSKLAV